MKISRLFRCSNSISMLGRVEAERDFTRKIWSSCVRRGELAVILWRGVKVRSFRRIVRIEKLLGRTGARVTLRIEAIRASLLESLQRLLRRLARYGDRVSIYASEHISRALRVDSSVFHLVTVPTSSVR